MFKVIFPFVKFVILPVKFGVMYCTSGCHSCFVDQETCFFLLKLRYIKYVVCLSVFSTKAIQKDEE